MKKLFAAIIILAATAPLGATAGCSEITGSCVTAIKVTNDSVSNETYDILIDGVRVGAITPGGSDTFTTTPGHHVVSINFASGGIACTPAAPSVEECQTFGLVCRA